MLYPVPPPITLPAESKTTVEIDVLESSIVGWSFCTWPTTAPTQPGSKRLACTSTSDVERAEQPLGRLAADSDHDLELGDGRRVGDPRRAAEVELKEPGSDTADPGGVGRDDAVGRVDEVDEHDHVERVVLG